MQCQTWKPGQQKCPSLLTWVNWLPHQMFQPQYHMGQTWCMKWYCCKHAFALSCSSDHMTLSSSLSLMDSHVLTYTPSFLHIYCTSSSKAHSKTTSWHGLMSTSISLMAKPVHWKLYMTLIDGVVHSQVDNIRNWALYPVSLLFHHMLAFIVLVMVVTSNNGQGMIQRC